MLFPTNNSRYKVEGVRKGTSLGLVKHSACHDENVNTQDNENTLFSVVELKQSHATHKAISVFYGNEMREAYIFLFQNNARI